MPDEPWEPSHRERRVLLALLVTDESNPYENTLIRTLKAPALARLESHGWVSGELRNYLGGPQRRKIYALTPEGRKAALGFLKLED
jgi:hypothetical protein